MWVCVVSLCDFAYLYVPRTQCANRQQQSKVNNQIAEWAEKNIIHAFICGQGVLLEMWSVQRCCCCCCCCVGDDSLGNSIRCFLNLFQSLVHCQSTHYNSNIIFVLFLFSISQKFRFDQLTLASCVADDNRFTLYAWLSRCCRVFNLFWLEFHQISGDYDGIALFGSASSSSTSSLASESSIRRPAAILC